MVNLKNAEREYVIMEGNILEYPIFKIAREKKEKRDEYKWDEKDAKGNLVKRNKFIIEGTRGLPGSFDLDVFNAMMRIYLKHRDVYKKNEVHFTVYEIAKELGIILSGELVNRIRDSLLRMSHTILDFENTFYIEKEKLTRVVHLIGNLNYYEKKKGNRVINMVKAILDDEVVGSIERNYFKLIDFGTYKSLPPGLPRRLYEYLEKKKYQKDRFEIGVKKLAERIPLKTKKISQIKGYLDKAHGELVNQGVIDRWEYKQSNVIYHFRKSERFKEVERDLFFFESLVTKFYDTIGQARVSKKVVHEGIELLRGLNAEGYSYDEIEYSLGWVVDSIEEVRSIKILPKVIGLAVSEMESLKIKKERAGKEAAKRKKEREEIQKERGREEFLEEEFKRLRKKNRDAMEKKAMDNLLSQGYKPEFIYGQMIKGERNRILEGRLKKGLSGK